MVRRVPAAGSLRVTWPLTAEFPHSLRLVRPPASSRAVASSSRPGDIRDESFCTQLVERSVQALGGIDILVSNAGRQQAHDSILDISTEQFDWTMKTNIYAPFWIIKAALPHLQPGSSIIATASEQAYDPSPELYDYAQTKAATMNFVKSLAKQLEPKGIWVTVWHLYAISG
jgi:NAD(P)-dependent dehydrogenase (short-subunit alcohol dehydrogenase family)